ALGELAQPDRGLQLLPGARLRARDLPAGEGVGGLPAGEVLEVELEPEQRGGPAVVGALAAEAGAHDADDAGAAGAGLDEELGRLRAVALGEAQPARRLGVGDLGLAAAAGHVVEGDAPALDLGGHEPGADAGSG